MAKMASCPADKIATQPAGRPNLFDPPQLPPHGLSFAQIGALSAICGTLLPPLSPSGQFINRESLGNDNAQKIGGSVGAIGDNVKENGGEKGLSHGREEVSGGYGTFKSSLTAAQRTFYRMSAADGGIPEKVAGLMRWRLKEAAMAQVSLILWLLSTTLGTLLLAGRDALIGRFPFAKPFPNLPPQQRERILKAWSRSRLLPFRTLFKVFKSITTAVIFTEVDEDGGSPIWDAIGYVGPDPALTKFDRGSDKLWSGGEVHRGQKPPKEMEGADVKPLAHAVVQLPPERGSVEEALSEAGCTVLPGLKSCQGLLKSAEGENVEVTVVECDAVVVGSGSGGGVVAAQLAHAGMRVLVLEKGAYYARSDLSLLEGPSMSAMYDTGGLLATEDGAFSLLAGSTVGGGSTINWAASFRTPPHVRREWAQDYGLKRYEGREFDEALEAVCERLGVHATSTEHGFTNAVLWNGCEKLDYPVQIIPRNAPGAHSCNWCGLGCRNGAKQSTAETWLVDAATRGTKILAGCTVERVLIGPIVEGKADKELRGRSRQACGVIARLGEGAPARRLVVEATTVVVAGGSIQTPALLLRSGLRNPNIGRTLRIHPVGAVWAYFPEERGPPGRSYEGGIMTACSTVAANWDSSGYGALLQTPWIHPGLASSVIAWQGGAAYKETILRYQRVASLIAVTRDRGFGRVEIDSKGTPLVHYSLCKEDKEHMMVALEHGLRVLRAAGAQELSTLSTLCKPFCCENTTDQDFEEYLRSVRKTGLEKNSTPFFSAHQTGSCRMGIDPKTSAVDPEGEIWEVKGLYLGDGSVLATPPGVNPMITIQSVAYCIGQGIAKRYAKVIQS